MPGAVEALQRLTDTPWLKIVVTNQSGVGRGYYEEGDVKHFHNYMNESLKQRGASIDSFYYCPHHPEAPRKKYNRECECRKPKPGLLRQAGDDFDIDFTKSVLIGDSERDIQAGTAMGCRTLLLKDGESESSIQTEADKIVPDLATAIESVVSDS
jgi:D-glycero-D-manno-heptose 1,7-bisphosphate phosphatase